MDEFDELLVKAFERFLSYVGDRPIVVSLSGGYDSRLILSMLERLGHEDVIAFTCHKGSDEDVELAERIANIAGVPWEYAELSHDDWRRFYESDDWERIHREGNCLSGNVFVFDVLPIQQLEAAGRIPDDAVFVCGHTAVDPARPMNRYLRSERSYSVGQVTDDIIDFHHCQWDFQGDAIESHVRDRIAEEIGTEPFETRRDAVEAYEQWRWRERESKYIVSHHVRVYDYVGHDWWLPLYDQDLLEFWSRVPIDAKGGRELYQRYTERLFSDVFDIPIQEARRTTGSPSLVASVESLVSGTPVKSVASDVYHTYKDIRTSFAAENDKMETYRDDPRLGIVGERTYQKACDVAEHFEGFHSMAELDLVSFDDPASSRIPRDGVFAWDAPPLADFAEAEDGTQSK